MSNLIVPALRRRIAKARRNGETVVYVCDSHKAKDPEFARMGALRAELLRNGVLHSLQCLMMLNAESFRKIQGTTFARYRRAFGQML